MPAAFRCLFRLRRGLQRPPRKHPGAAGLFGKKISRGKRIEENQPVQNEGDSSAGRISRTLHDGSDDAFATLITEHHLKRSRAE